MNYTPDQIRVKPRLVNESDEQALVNRFARNAERKNDLCVFKFLPGVVSCPFITQEQNHVHSDYAEWVFDVRRRKYREQWYDANKLE